MKARTAPTPPPSAGISLTRDPNTVVVTAGGATHRIHREDADPEHRFQSYRLAAAWFGNRPAEQP